MKKEELRIKNESLLVLNLSFFIPNFLYHAHAFDVGRLREQVNRRNRLYVEATSRKNLKIAGERAGMT